MADDHRTAPPSPVAHTPNLQRTASLAELRAQAAEKQAAQSGLRVAVAEDQVQHANEHVRAAQAARTQVERKNRLVERRAVLAEERAQANENWARHVEHDLQVVKKESGDWIQRLEHDIQELNQGIQGLNQNIGALNHQLTEIHTSTTWKVARHLFSLERSLKQKLKPPAETNAPAALPATPLPEHTEPASAPASATPTPAEPASHAEAATPPTAATPATAPTPAETATKAAAAPATNTTHAPAPLEGLPAGFDPDLYLALNPDLAEQGVDPAHHYIQFGQYEERPWQPDALHVRDGHCRHPDAPWRLLVVPDASASSVTAVSLQLARAWSTQFNVAVLLLGNGPMNAAFTDCAAEVLTEPQARDGYSLAHATVQRILQRHTPQCAVVTDGFECTTILQPLIKHHVPVISLIHGVGSHAYLHLVFQEVLFWSTRTLFTSQHCLDLAFQCQPMLRTETCQMLPLCVPELDETAGLNRPASLHSGEPAAQASQPAGPLAACQPPDLPFLDSTRTVVLGAGPVRYESGLDLFIQTAACVRALPGTDRIRFVWVGNPTPDADSRHYAVAIHDQIERAGLRDTVFLVPRDQAPHPVLQATHVFFHTHRSGPLPALVASALHAGLPAVCFDPHDHLGALLYAHGLGEACVAPCLGIAQAAGRIQALADPALRTRLQPDCMALGTRLLSGNDLAERLEHTIGQAIEAAQCEKNDIQAIQGSGRLAARYFASRHTIPNAEDTQTYVRAWRTGLHARKPYPGFHPGIYAAACLPPSSTLDPFVHFLEQGEPDGAWSYPVISNTQAAQPLPAGVRVALHLHAYYPELLDDMLDRLLLNTARPDLFISVKDEASLNATRQILARYPGTVAALQVVPNTGRDIGPFLTAFGETLCQNYDLIGHLHTKQSLFAHDREAIHAWRTFLLENLLGGPLGGAMADRILGTLAQNPAIGLVFADDPNLLGWDANRSFAETLQPALGLDTLPDAFNFPVGTMFWLRAPVLQRFVDLKTGWSDYPAEPLPPDGTWLHALERLFGIVPAALGLRSAVTTVEGLSR